MSYVTLQEGTHDGNAVIKARVRQALTMEHAISLMCEVLNDRGFGDVEMYAAEHRNGAYEVWWKRPEGWDDKTQDAVEGPLLPWME